MCKCVWCMRVCVIFAILLLLFQTVCIHRRLGFYLLVSLTISCRLRSNSLISLIPPVTLSISLIVYVSKYRYYYDSHCCFYLPIYCTFVAFASTSTSHLDKLKMKGFGVKNFHHSGFVLILVLVLLPAHYACVQVGTVSSASIHHTIIRNFQQITNDVSAYYGNTFVQISLHLSHAHSRIATEIESVSDTNTFMNIHMRQNNSLLDLNQPFRI